MQQFTSSATTFVAAALSRVTSSPTLARASLPWLLLLSGSAGCASVLPPWRDEVRPSTHVALHETGSGRQVKLEGPRFYGADSEVMRIGNSYRGRVRGLPVHLSTNGEQIIGQVGGGGVTSLSVHDSGDRFVVQGIWHGGTTAFAVTPTRIVGKAGVCTYDFAKLSSATSWYEGEKRCGGVRALSASFQLPDDWNARAADDKGVALALVLGR